MSASFTGPGGIDPLAAFARLRASAVITEGDGLAAGQALRTDIRDDTAKGIDSEGNPFTPYSDHYAKQKAKRGRNTNVDLFGSKQGSHMLNAILIKAGSAQSSGSDIVSNYGTAPIHEIRLGIYSADEARRAEVHNQGGSVRTRQGTGKSKPKKGGVASFNMPRRHFFDANSQRVARMERLIGERLEARLKTV